MKSRSVRYHTRPRDAPKAIAARRLGLTESEFQSALDDLIGRGFPSADETTGNFDLKAIDIWMDRRSRIASSLYSGAIDAAAVVGDRIARMSRGRSS